MSIHHEHPFQPAEGDRSPVRRLRGRLPSPVTVFTAEHDQQRTGLTVSSVLVVDGDPGAIIAVIDPLSDLHDTLQKSRVAVVNVLGWAHRSLADAFGYIAPAPGGPFRMADWVVSPWGPVLAGALGWAGCRLSDQPPIEVGWGLQVQLNIERIEPPADDDSLTPPLAHQRGRYLKL